MTVSCFEILRFFKIPVRDRMDFSFCEYLESLKLNTSTEESTDRLAQGKWINGCTSQPVGFMTDLSYSI